MPTRYHKYLDMSKKSKSQFLYPRRKYNFSVEMMPSLQPQAGRVISLSPSDRDSLDNMINKGLANSTIFRTMSSWVTPVFFASNKDGHVHPRFKYQPWNIISVNKNYPPPLKMETADSRLDSNKYTKLDICNMYGNLIFAEGNEDKLVFITS